MLRSDSSSSEREKAEGAGKVLAEPAAQPGEHDGLAEERGYLDRSAKRGEGELDRDLAEEVVALALEELVVFHREHDAEVARFAAGAAGLAVARGAQARTGVDAGRDGAASMSTT